MTPLVVDASVALKWFVPEVLADEASRLLDGSYELWAPDLLVAECGNTAWKKVARGELAISEARDVLAALAQVPLNLVTAPELVQPALEIAASLRCTVYDSLYVALAVARDCTLVTADDRLVRLLAGSPLGDRVRSLAAIG